ncbi:MAG: metallophosphoesterase family protein [Spirochaetales bacterium]|nr:metallophosphoesterase family protein [Spirochaetales bacterium]
MRYAILSDIHSNLEALYAVRQKLQTMRIDKILCLGDIVGYNADPALCIQWVNDNASCIVRGNHDKAVFNMFHEKRFNHYARDAIRWTRKVLSGNEKTCLKTLTEGPKEEPEGIVLCHGTPFDEDAYLHSPESAEESFTFLDENMPNSWICFFGHTHVPVVIDDQDHLILTEKPVTLSRSKRYLINPGSVGQPRDEDCRASFGVLDDEKNSFELVRVPYNIEETQRKILMKGLPEVLASRLSVGR